MELCPTTDHTTGPQPVLDPARRQSRRSPPQGDRRGRAGLPLQGCPRPSRRKSTGVMRNDLGRCDQRHRSCGGIHGWPLLRPLRWRSGVRCQRPARPRSSPGVKPGGHVLPQTNRRCLSSVPCASLFGDRQITDIDRKIRTELRCNRHLLLDARDDELSLGKVGQGDYLDQFAG